MYRHGVWHGLSLERGKTLSVDPHHLNIAHLIRTRFSLSIRTKLLLVSLILLIIPYIGFQSIQDLENFLRKDQEKALLEYARIVAETVKESTGTFTSLSATTPTTSVNAQQQKHLFIRSLHSPIQLDGYAAGDWEIYRDRRTYYQAESPWQPTKEADDTIPKVMDNKDTDRLSFFLQTGHYNRYLYAFFQIKDKHIVYRKPNDNNLLADDHILISLEEQPGIYSRYVIATFSPGLVSAQNLLQQSADTLQYKSDNRITAAWLETGDGYNVEMRIPISMVGNHIAITVVDVDDENTRSIASAVNVTGTSAKSTESTIAVAPSSVEQLLSRIKRRSTRIWLTDNDARVVALSGELIENELADSRNEDLQPEDSMDITMGEVFTGLVRIFYQAILKQPAEEFRDDLSNASQLTGEEIKSALKGIPATQWRLTPDSRVNILTAAYPVKEGDKIIGTVAIEETSNSILILQNRAFQILINLSIIAFIIATFTLLLFASRLSFRITRLRDDADNAISDDGRVISTEIVRQSRDEIGDLADSISDMLNRLAQYNKYLETMASKLAHELRTPITVVKSSLENLESSLLDDETQTYIQRAKEGIDRLGRILTRMSEATRLEQTLQEEKMILFNLEDLLASCVGGYQSANPEHSFTFSVINQSEYSQVMIKGAPDLIAQLLDKLVSNARDFALPGSVIEIGLNVSETNAKLTVSNEGPELPGNIQTNLFDSMVSAREKRDNEPHLGLGLYIVRLITEFHGGSVSAMNRTQPKGVTFQVTLPLSA